MLKGYYNVLRLAWLSIVYLSGGMVVPGLRTKGVTSL